jgi:D-proline reductase (dithiol) PrdB
LSKLERFITEFPWVRNESIPFVSLNRNLADCKVALVSTGGLYAPADKPFGIVTREDVDESHREIPLGLPIATLGIAHEHFNKTYSQEDMNVIFPVERLQALAEEGYIRAVAEMNYSVSGYIPVPHKLFDTGRAIAQSMLAQGVDAALLVPV